LITLNAQEYFFRNSASTTLVLTLTVAFWQEMSLLSSITLTSLAMTVTPDTIFGSMKTRTVICCDVDIFKAPRILLNNSTQGRRSSELLAIVVGGIPENSKVKHSVREDAEN
jgi:hypothetical protein